MLQNFILEEPKKKAGFTDFHKYILFFSTNHTAHIALDIFIILVMFEKWQN